MKESVSVVAELLSITIDLERGRVGCVRCTNLKESVSVVAELLSITIDFKLERGRVGCVRCTKEAASLSVAARKRKCWEKLRR
jgi:hypothetical protein